MENSEVHSVNASVGQIWCGSYTGAEDFVSFPQAIMTLLVPTVAIDWSSMKRCCFLSRSRLFGIYVCSSKSLCSFLQLLFRGTFYF